MRVCIKVGGRGASFHAFHGRVVGVIVGGALIYAHVSERVVKGGHCNWANCHTSFGIRLGNLAVRTVSS